MAITLTHVGAGCAPFATVPAERLAGLASAPGTLSWVDALDPSPAELEALGEAVALPALAVEDALEGRQRPKIDHYPDCVVVVTYAATIDGPTATSLSFHELHLLVTRALVVTVRRRAIPDIEAVRHRLCASGKTPPGSPTALAHAILDHVVDTYFAALERVQTRIEEIDEDVWSRPPEADLTEAFALRRDLARFRRIVSPMREVLSVMVRREAGVLDDAVDEQFRDLYDHVITVHEEIEMSRELLAAALEGHMSVVSNRLNEVVLKVSAWAAIIAVPTVIASVYGMNFDHMPELHWGLGYPFALALMTGCALALYLVFKRRRWL